MKLSQQSFAFWEVMSTVTILLRHRDLGGQFVQFDAPQGQLRGIHIATWISAMYLIPVNLLLLSRHSFIYVNGHRLESAVIVDMWDIVQPNDEIQWRTMTI